MIALVQLPMLKVWRVTSGFPGNDENLNGQGCCRCICIHAGRNRLRLDDEPDYRPPRSSGLQAEGTSHRANDLDFRYTRDAGGRDARWENRRASIVVTGKSVLIHKNDKVGLEIGPATRRYVDVARDGSRVRIRAGSGRSAGSLVVRAGVRCRRVDGCNPRRCARIAKHRQPLKLTSLSAGSLLQPCGSCDPS